MSEHKTNSGNKPQSNTRNRRSGGNNYRQGNRNNNRSNNNNRNNRNSKPPRKPQNLTFWQKVLALFGVAPKSSQPQRNTRPKTHSQPKTQSKTNTNNTNKPRQPKSVEVTSGRLYVGNLSYETTEFDIEELFKGNGSVKSVEIIYNRHTHKSKGYGFVEMLNIDDAKNAVKVHHDQPFMGRNLIVNGAKERQPENAKPDAESASA